MTLLDDNAPGAPLRRRPWPRTAAALNAAMGGYGTWASAWEPPLSGNLSDLIGSVTLTAESTPTYAHKGPTVGGVAVGFDSGGVDNFKAGAAGTFDLDAVTSLAVMLIMRAPAAGASQGFGGKLAAAQPYWYFLCANASGHPRLALSDGVDTATTTIAADHCDGEWHIVLFIIDRTANEIIAISDLGSSTAASLAAVGTLSNTDLFRIGGHPLDASLGHQIGYAAVATGGIVALRANASTAIATLRRHMRIL